MPVTLSPTELTELICTRISHDLIGNIGAVSNAVELLEDDEQCAQEIKPILETSARTLASRLKFFRMAFGLNNVCPKTIDEIRKVAVDYLGTLGGRTTKIAIELEIAVPDLYKIVLPAIMMLSDVFVRSGTISVMQNKDGMTFEAVSDAPLSLPKLAALSKALEGVMSEENPSQTAPALYLVQFLADKNVKLSFSYETDRAVLIIA